MPDAISPKGRWLTYDELTRALNSAGIPKTHKTVRHWPRKAPGISRLIAGRRMFDPRLLELLLAGHSLRDIGAALQNGAALHRPELPRPAQNAMTLRDAARNLLRLHRQCPDLFEHVLPISEEDLATLEEIAEEEEP